MPRPPFRTTSPNKLRTIPDRPQLRENSLVLLLTLRLLSTLVLLVLSCSLFSSSSVQELNDPTSSSPAAVILSARLLLHESDTCRLNQHPTSSPFLPQHGQTNPMGYNVRNLSTATFISSSKLFSQYSASGYFSLVHQDKLLHRQARWVGTYQNDSSTS